MSNHNWDFLLELKGWVYLYDVAYKLLFIFTNRWRNDVADLETLAIGFVVLLNTIGNKNFNQKNKDEDFDKAAEDLRLATRHLGMIVGKVDVEEILGSIFNDFCIGK